jgi:hypothetical protein
MAFAYFLKHSPWLLGVIFGFWIIYQLWKGWRRYQENRRREDWNDLSKPSSPKFHARNLPRKQGAHDWY